MVQGILFPGIGYYTIPGIGLEKRKWTSNLRPKDRPFFIMIVHFRRMILHFKWMIVHMNAWSSIFNDRPFSMIVLRRLLMIESFSNLPKWLIRFREIYQNDSFGSCHGTDNFYEKFLPKKIILEPKKLKTVPLGSNKKKDSKIAQEPVSVPEIRKITEPILFSVPSVGSGPSLKIRISGTLKISENARNSVFI